MICLLPFLNCFLLFICLEENQLLNKPYKWIQENILVRLPSFLIAILGGCIMCTATWLGIIEIILCNFHKSIIYLPEKYILILSYNAITTTILYKLLKNV